MSVEIYAKSTIYSILQAPLCITVSNCAYTPAACISVHI